MLEVQAKIFRKNTVVSTTDITKFYGKELRKVRFISQEKAWRTEKVQDYKEDGRKEIKIVDNLLHKISREIVERAK